MPGMNDTQPLPFCPWPFEYDGTDYAAPVRVTLRRRDIPEPSYIREPLGVGSVPILVLLIALAYLVVLVR